MSSNFNFQKLFLFFVLIFTHFLLDANPQDIIDEGGLTCSDCPTDSPVKKEEVTCKRYPDKSVLFSSDNFPANYNQVSAKNRKIHINK